MTSQLTIEPLERKKTVLSSELKFALRKRNSCGTVRNMNVSSSDIPYFQALSDMGVEDAQRVISLIQKFEECVIQEEF